MQNDYKEVTNFIQFFKNNNKNKGGNTRAESVVHAWRAVKGDDGEKIRKALINFDHQLMIQW